MYVCLSVCMHVCLSVCMYVCLSVCMYVCLSVCICMYVWMYVWMYVCLDVCLFVDLSYLVYLAVSIFPIQQMYFIVCKTGLLPTFLIILNCPFEWTGCLSVGWVGLELRDGGEMAREKERSINSAFKSTASHTHTHGIYIYIYT